MNVVLFSRHAKRAADIFQSQLNLSSYSDTPTDDLAEFEFLLNSTLGLVDPFEAPTVGYFDIIDEIPTELLDLVISMLEEIKKEKLWRAMVIDHVKQIKVLNSQGLVYITMEPRYEHNARVVANFIKRLV